MGSAVTFTCHSLQALLLLASVPSTLLHARTLQNSVGNRCTTSIGACRNPPAWCKVSVIFRATLLVAVVVDKCLSSYRGFFACCRDVAFLTASRLVKVPHTERYGSAQMQCGDLHSGYISNLPGTSHAHRPGQPLSEYRTQDKAVVRQLQDKIGVTGKHVRWRK
jgi:hypothetical protein